MFMTSFANFWDWVSVTYRCQRDPGISDSEAKFTIMFLKDFDSK